MSLRIALLCYRGNMYCGGQGVYTHYLSRELARLGHEVHVLAGPPYPMMAPGVHLHRIGNYSFWPQAGYRPPAGRPWRLFAPLALADLGLTRLQLFPEMLTFSLRAFHHLARLGGPRRFDVVHDNQTLAYGLLFMQQWRVPVVATVHHPLGLDLQAELQQAPGARDRIRKLLRYPPIMQELVTRRLDRIIAVSHSAAEEIRHWFGVPPERLHVVYNGVDAQVFHGNGHRREANRLLFVGNTQDRKKGVLYLLRALRELRGELDARLTIVDKRWQTPQYPDDFAPQLVRRYGLEGAVTWAGHLPTAELVHHYNTAALVTTPSTYEGFGFTAAEAMACETPVVASAAGALPEVVAHGQTGLLVPPRDPLALAGAVGKLLGDAEQRRAMGAAGRARVTRRFAWAEAAEQIVRVYQEARQR